MFSNKPYDNHDIGGNIMFPVLQYSFSRIIVGYNRNADDDIIEFCIV